MFYFRMSSAAFNQQYQKIYGYCTKPCAFSECNSSGSQSGFKLKFHNDGSTSTTDLHYFSSRLHHCEWHPITSSVVCASVQTDIPPGTTAPCPTVCANHCFCSHDSKRNARSSEIDIGEECSCDKVHRNRSEASMSSAKTSSKAKRGLKKKNSLCKNNHQKRSAKKTSKVECECRKPNTTDKSVTTYTDQASNCIAEERKTQTSPSKCTMSSFSSSLNKHTMSKDGLATELWFPKSPPRRKSVDVTTPEKIIGVYETDCSSDSCCCSATDTDARGD
ncbi:unnamed protein product [Diatraea saccharalis]|uniref:Uncharacterized protein n=1 Tax=Diatraea saccharalis TaxID=40085 RepID=A0A9P0C6B1_9NEOP|nr:unnamed protein product [Diatraea saccharalis]